MRCTALLTVLLLGCVAQPSVGHSASALISDNGGTIVVSTPDQTTAGVPGYDIVDAPGMGGLAPGGGFATAGGRRIFATGKGGPGDLTHGPGHGGGAEGVPQQVLADDSCASIAAALRAYNLVQ